MANEAGPTGDCSTFSVILVEKLFLIISSQFTVLKNALPLASCNRLIGILQMWKAKFSRKWSQLPNIDLDDFKLETTTLKAILTQTSANCLFPCLRQKYTVKNKREKTPS